MFTGSLMYCTMGSKSELRYNDPRSLVILDRLYIVNA